MMNERFKKFVENDFALEIYHENSSRGVKTGQKEKLIFRSRQNKVKGLLKFIKKYGKRFKNLTVFDTRVGNAAALLIVYIGAREAFAKIGSISARKTFKKFKIKYHFLQTIPHILNKKGDGLCPLEKLSFSKTPEEFLESAQIFLKMKV
ncbi:MAG: DUF1893 domain-containing protein [bacterium]|nr:DUF1893 domain-containing protein [bacterium]